MEFKIYFVIASVFLLTTAGTSAAVSITVDDGDGADYTSIQEAVNNADDGDIILVYPGNYKENIDVYKRLTIMSQSGNPNDAVVQAADREDHVFHITSDHVNISGFKVTGGIRNTTMYKGGIYVDGVSHCIISNNIASNNGNGIYLSYPANNNILINNTANSNKYYGILVSFSNYNKLKGNDALNNKIGLFIDFSNNNTLEYNHASNNENGVCIEYSNDNKLNSNTANLNSNKGIYLSHSNNNSFRSNIVFDNIGDYGFGIFLSSLSCNNTLLNNTIHDNNCNLYIDERAENNMLKDNIISGELVGYDEIIERSLERREKEKEKFSTDYSSVDCKPLEFGPDTFEELKNGTNVIAAYGKMPSFENETERRNWLGKLMEMGKGARNETEVYFHPNGSVISTGCGINGCLEVGILEGTDIDNSTQDEIYKIFERQAEEIGVDEVPVVFRYEGFIVDEEVLEEPATEILQNTPGFQIMSTLLGLLIAFMFVNIVKKD